MEFLLNNILEHMKYPKLLHLLFLSKRINEISRNKLIERSIHLKKDTDTNALKNIMNYFNLQRVDLSHSYITDDAIECLQNCRNVNLNWCSKITDKCLPYLGRCHTVNLNLTKITKLDELKKCKNLSLFSCQSIKKDEIKNLQNCHITDVNQTSIAYNFPSYQTLNRLHKIDISSYDISDILPSLFSQREYYFSNLTKLKNCYKINIDPSFKKHQILNEKKYNNLTFLELGFEFN